MIIIVASLIPIARADTEIILNEDDVSLMPTVFGYRTAVDAEEIMGFTVADDGKMFTVSYNSHWRIVHGQTQVSLIAWGSDGAVLWSHITNHFDRVYCDVTCDKSNIYVVGTWNNDIIVEKFSFEGDLIWNTTYDSGYTERGYEISLMGDGTIIIGGSRWPSSYSYPPDGEDRKYILLALNQTGQPQWCYSYQEYPCPRCDSNYLFIAAENILQKKNSSGMAIWQVDFSEGRFGGAQGEIAYTISALPSLEHYESYTIFPISLYDTEINTTTWNYETGIKIDSSYLQLCDADKQLFNCSYADAAIDQDGFIRILMVADEMESWYLMCLNQTADLISFIKLLDGHWWGTQFEMDESGNAYIASTSLTYGLTVMKFDAAQLSSTETPTSTSTSTTGTQTGNGGSFELTDLQVISSVIVGVALFDAVLIVYLKRKAAG